MELRGEKGWNSQDSRKTLEMWLTVQDRHDSLRKFCEQEHDDHEKKHVGREVSSFLGSFLLDQNLPFLIVFPQSTNQGNRESDEKHARKSLNGPNWNLQLIVS